MEPVVTTTSGRVQGTVHEGAAVFLGIPYAAPPFGDRRFTAPAPPESWRWAGPRWTGGAPADRNMDRGIEGITVQATDPDRAAARWRAVLDAPLESITFATAANAADEGMVAVRVRGLDHTGRRAGVQQLRLCVAGPARRTGNWSFGGAELAR